MDDNLLQTIDSPQDNPAAPDTNQPTDAKKRFSKDPKIIVLIILVSIIIILSITAVVVSATKKPTPTKNIEPTNNELVEPTKLPTSSVGQIPKEFQDQFNQIEKEINQSEILLPPQIDTEIGIISQ